MALGSWTRAQSGRGNHTGLRPRLLKANIKGKSHFTSSSRKSFYLMPSHPFSSKIVQDKFPQSKLSISQGNQDSEKTAQDYKTSHYGTAWTSSQVSLATSGLPLSHIESSTSVALERHLELPEQLAPIRLPDSGQTLLMTSTFSTWPYGSFIAVSLFRAFSTLGRKNLSEPSTVSVGEGFSQLPGRRSWFGTKEKRKVPVWKNQ